MTKDVLRFMPEGIYCPAGDFYIDPWRAVDRALITHAHADHARSGHGCYLCTNGTAPVLRLRLGDVQIQTISYGHPLTIGGAQVSFHPAGHVPGSAQIRVEVDGQAWVVSGDYKLEDDGLSEAFEPVRCHSFISECTFGMPVFSWAPQGDIATAINAWWQTAGQNGKTAMIGAYSLGKAQRILSLLDPAVGPILTHAAVDKTTSLLRAHGYDLPDTQLLDTTAKPPQGAMVIAPPAAIGSNWANRFGPVTTAVASGWMALRGVRRRRSVDQGFTLSDHADWQGLNRAIDATGAERIYVTHGYTTVFRKWLEDQGYDARIVETEFAGDDAEPTEEALS